MKSLKLFLAVAILSFSFKGNSQAYLGVHSSNYAGVMGTDFNPASFVDGRFSFDLNLASGNVNFYTNAASFNTSGMPKWWTKSFKSDVHTQTGEKSTIIGGSNPYNDWMVPDSTLADRYLNKNYDVNLHQCCSDAPFAQARNEAWLQRDLDSTRRSSASPLAHLHPPKVRPILLP